MTATVAANGRDARAAPPITVIADGTALHGSVRVAGDLRVDGAVEGEFLEALACEVAARGSVSVRTVRARRLVVHGRMLAEHVVAESLVVMADGHVAAQRVTVAAVDVESRGALVAQLEVGPPEPAAP